MRSTHTSTIYHHIKIKMVLTFTCISFFFTFSGQAQIDIDSIERINKMCHEDGPQTTASAMGCEKSARELWNVEINKYLKRLEKEDLVDAKLLAQQQEAWLNFYTTSVKLQSSFLSNYYQGGTMAWVAIETFKKRKVKERAIDLAQFYETIIEK